MHLAKKPKEQTKKTTLKIPLNNLALLISNRRRQDSPCQGRTGISQKHKWKYSAAACITCSKIHKYLEFLYKTNALEEKFPISDPQFLKIKVHYCKGSINKCKQNVLKSDSLLKNYSRSKKEKG